MSYGTTLKKQRKVWIWTAIDRRTRKLIAFESGSRGKKTLKRLLVKLSKFNIKKFCTDYWKVYKSLIPNEKLIQSKKETYTVESINCNIRHYLARFRRRSRCYSKCPTMVELSMWFLFERDLYLS